MSTGVAAPVTVTRPARGTPTSAASLSLNSRAAPEPFVVLVLDQALVTRLVEDVRHLLRGEGRGDLVLGLDAEQPDQRLGQPVHRPITGATTRDTMTSAGTSATAERSGRAIEMFFGIISP